MNFHKANMDGPRFMCVKCDNVIDSQTNELSVKPLADLTHTYLHSNSHFPRSHIFRAIGKMQSSFAVKPVWLKAQRICSN